MRRELAAIVHGETPTHLHLRERLSRIAVVTIGVDLAAAVLVYFFDRHAVRSEIHTFGDSLFWTTCQLLTVSSQLTNPISTGARIVDVLLEAWSITVIATLAGAFGAFFHRRGLERHPMKPRATSSGSEPAAGG